MNKNPSKIGINYGDDIDLSIFDFSDEKIKKLQSYIIEIDQYFSKPITQENFQALVGLWHELISQIPLPTIPSDVNFIIRARSNNFGEIFEEESDISYNSKNVTAIEPSRFNRPQESVFYGTLPSDRQERFVIGASIESFKELISHDCNDEVIYYHFGKWVVKESFPLINLCFDVKAYYEHPGLQKVLIKYIQEIQQGLRPNASKVVLQFWNYLSSLSSQRKTSDQHYFITTAFFCTLREYYKIHANELINGLVYPSPMVYGQAINVVLMPYAVDKYLKLQDAFMFKYVRSIDNPKSFETAICSKPSKVENGKLNISGIVWGRDLGNYDY